MAGVEISTVLLLANMYLQYHQLVTYIVYEYDDKDQSSHTHTLTHTHSHTHTHTQTLCQQYTAQLKFESASGHKRLELHPPHGNKKLPGSPSTIIRLTHVLEINNGKQHALSRTKNSFQVSQP